MLHSPRQVSSTTDASKEPPSLETGTYQRASSVGAADLRLEAGDPGRPSHHPEYQKWAILSLMALTWVACGVAIYMWEGYSAVDSMYGIAQILSTVGYGNILPISQTTKLLTALLVLSSLVIASGCVSVFLDHILDKQNEILKGELEEAERRIRASALEMSTSLSRFRFVDTDGGGSGGLLPRLIPSMCSDTATTGAGDGPASSTVGLRPLLASFIFYAGFVLAGTLFFGIYEACTCGDGPSLVEGCDVDDCKATNGHRKTMVDAFYMSVVTLSTVGFGDETPLSWGGKLFSIFWILFGVGSTVNFVGDLTDWIHKTEKSAQNNKISEELFQTMDQDGNGMLDRVEFLKLQVVMQGLAKPEEIDTMLRQFDLIDRGNDGTISLEEVKAYYK